MPYEQLQRDLLDSVIKLDIDKFIKHIDRFLCFPNIDYFRELFVYIRQYRLTVIDLKVNDYACGNCGGWWSRIHSYDKYGIPNSVLLLDSSDDCSCIRCVNRPKISNNDSLVLITPECLQYKYKYDDIPRYDDGIPIYNFRLEPMSHQPSGGWYYCFEKRITITLSINLIDIFSGLVSEICGLQQLRPSLVYETTRRSKYKDNHNQHYKLVMEELIYLPPSGIFRGGIEYQISHNSFTNIQMTMYT